MKLLSSVLIGLLAILSPGLAMDLAGMEKL